jgi:NADH:ubiquinone oxidoreductase subunit F (NADH-binding)/(2Fe-2S) ferredoxin
MKTNSLEMLEKWRDELRSSVKYDIKIMVCSGTSCIASESDLIFGLLKQKIEDNHLEHQIELVPTGCQRLCGQGPMITIEPGNTTYFKVKVQDVEELFNEHVLAGRIVHRLLYVDPKTAESASGFENIGFYRKQKRIALRNCGEINPQSINDYIRRDGYKALGNAVKVLSPKEVVDIVKASGLRGRGGGGFSTGLKWEMTAKAKGNEKYLICNADEGDPGAFMDRSIIEGDPHSLVEAMAIAGYATGASSGLVYIRAEYATSIPPLKKAIEDAKANGFLGSGIFGSDFSFDISIKLGAGAFVCGEETALIHSMEGNRGEPTKKPPFPSESGFRGKPTTVNNVETLVNIPQIILNGAKWFRSFGTEKSPGTKVFALAGNIRNIGLVEVPMGTTFREIIFDIGGGHPAGKNIKAIQIGGPSGGVITEENFDTPIEYDTLTKIGAMMGRAV